MTGNANERCIIIEKEEFMMAQLKERAADLREAVADYMKEEVAFTKLDFYLLGAVLFLAGVCIGLLTAPFTHGISIGSHNGSNNGNNCRPAEPCEEEDEGCED